MSNGPPVSPVIDFPSSSFESESLVATHLPEMTTVLSPAVLLVGRSGSWGMPVLKSIEKFGAESSFASPQNATAKYVQENRFTIVLLDSTVSSEERRRLASELVGSSVSVFYTFPVENGCWWLPMLRRGRECQGAPAFSRNEFPLELERILGE